MKKSFSPAWIAALLLVFALLLRVGALFSFSKSIYFHHPFLDEQIYHNLASAIASGTQKSEDIYEFPPLYAYLMGLIYRLLAPDTLYARIVNILFGMGTCLGVFHIGKLIGGNRTALISLAFAACYGPFVLYSVVPLKTSLSLLLFSLFILAFLQVLFRREWWWALILGVLAGLMINVRPNYLIVLPAAALFLTADWWRDRENLSAAVIVSLLAIVGFCAATFPFAYRNYRVAGDFTLLTSQAGFNLYQGNNLENATPYYRPVPFASTSPFEQSSHFTIEASRRVGRLLSAEESSRYWRKEVIRLAVENPLWMLKTLTIKAVAVWNRDEMGDHYCLDFLKGPVPFFRLPLLPFWLILPFAVVGLSQAFRQNKQVRGVAFILTFYAVSLVLFYLHTRYRLPLLVILLPLSAVGLECLVACAYKKDWRKGCLLGAVFVVSLAVSWIPFAGSGDRSAYHNLYAMLLMKEGRRIEAMSFWQLSSELEQTYSPFADLALASMYMAKRDYETALSHLEKIAPDSFAGAQKYAIKGDLLLMRGNDRQAIDMYSRSLQINFAQNHVRRRLIALLRRYQPRRAEMEIARYSEVKRQLR